MDPVDVSVLILRAAVGPTVVLHGWNHAFGGGRLPGTAAWFESMGLRPGRVHAVVATLTELGAGSMLVLGLFTPLVAGAVLGIMLVALVTAHLRNGFFIFRPGQGYEYVLVLSAVCLAIGALGGGRLSLDAALDLAWSWRTGLLTTACLGVGGASTLLLTCWRPQRATA